MTWFLAVLIVLAMGAVAVVAAGRGGSLGTAYDDRPDVRLPADRPVTGDDLRSLRFDTVLRGYRASEVDALIERLATQLDERDVEGEGEGEGEGDDHGDDQDDDQPSAGEFEEGRGGAE